MAISNARLFQQAQESLEAERRAYNQLTRREWNELARTSGGQGYRYDQSGIVALDGNASNGRVDDTAAPNGGTDGNGNVTLGGGGKGEWTGDNSSTAASFILVYNPNGVTALRNQIGAFTGDGSVITSSSPAANNVNLLVETVILNYMSMTNQIGQFPTLFNGFGSNPSAVLLDSLTAFGPLPGI